MKLRIEFNLLLGADIPGIPEPDYRPGFAPEKINLPLGEKPPFFHSFLPLKGRISENVI